MWPPCKKFPGRSGKAPVRGQPPPHGAGIGRGTGFSHVPCSPAKIFKISRYKAGAMRFLPHTGLRGRDPTSRPHKKTRSTV